MSIECQIDVPSTLVMKPAKLIVKSKFPTHGVQLLHFHVHNLIYIDFCDEMIFHACFQLKHLGNIYGKPKLDVNIKISTNFAKRRKTKKKNARVHESYIKGPLKIKKGRKLQSYI